MPQTDTTEQTPTPGRSQYSDPAARARHASLVRWGKEQPMSFQDRLNAIRAQRKAGKGRKAGRGGKGAKPKQTPEQRAQEKQTAIDTNRSKVYDTLGTSDAAIDALNDLESGKEPARADDLIKLGLAERDTDGNTRLTAHGREFARAADRGDAGAARDAISRGRDALAQTADRAKQQETRAAERAQAKETRAKEKAARDAARAQRQAERLQAAKERVKAHQKARREKPAPERAAPTDDRGARSPIHIAPVERPSPTPERAAPAPTRQRTPNEVAQTEQDRTKELAQAEAEGAAAARRARRASRRHQRRRMSTIVRNEGTKMLSDLLDELRAERKAQTPQERAMFANMGSSGGGGGKGGKKPTGGQGGLWPKGADGKRHPPGEGGAEAKPSAEAPKGDGKGDAPKTEGMTREEIVRRQQELQDKHRQLDRDWENARTKDEEDDIRAEQREIRAEMAKLDKTPIIDRRRDTREYRDQLDSMTNRVAEHTTERDRALADARQSRSDAQLSKQSLGYYEQRVKDAKTDKDRTEAQHVLEAARARVVEHEQEAQAHEARAREADRKLKDARRELDTLHASKDELAVKSEDTPMADFDTILSDLEATADALAETGDAAIKAGARNSAADMERIQQIYDAAEDICDLCEALGVATEDDETEPADEADLEGDAMEGKAQRTFGGKERAALDDSDFAGPNRTYPIMTAQDVADAAKLIGKADDPEAVKRKIIAIARRKGFADAIPAAWATKKDAADLIETIEGGAIKALDDGGVGGFAVLFGDAETPDLSHMRDYFTAKTDYWLDKFGWPRPMTYHHGMDEDTRDDPIVGSWTKAVVKDEGIWLEGQLDRSYRYHGAIKELIKRGALKLSSDSAPQWVIRERQPNGANEVKRWPLLTASPTVTPAEPRMAGLSFKAVIAELGDLAIADDSEADADEAHRQDAAKALQERARKLSLELELLSLETTT